MSLGENSLVAAYQGKEQLKSRPSGTRVVITHVIVMHLISPAETIEQRIYLHSQLRMVITLSQGLYMQNLKHNLEEVIKSSYPDDNVVLRPSSSLVSM